MDGYISSIKFKKIDSKHCYWLITVLDKNGNVIGTFGNPSISDRKNFRKQTFGIMSACDNFDLLTLATNDPHELEITYKEKNMYGGVKSIKNKRHETFFNDNQKYVLKRNFNPFARNDKDDIKATIECISSESGVFTIRVNSGYIVTHFVTGQIYYGFGENFPGGTMANQGDVSEMEDSYQSFIESILKLYHTNDLINLGRNITFYPQINIEQDENGKIIEIGNKEKNFRLREVEDEYIISNEKEKIKIK